MTVSCSPEVVAGLDLAAGRGTTALAFLALAPQGRPRLIEAPRLVATDDEILTLLNESGARIVAVDAPLTLPAPVMAALWSVQTGEGAGEALLGSPYTRAAERDPVWSAIGVRPLPVSFLGGLTLRALVLSARLREGCPGLRVVETFPSAVLRILQIRDAMADNGRAPRQARLSKTALPVRLATQRGLARWIAGLPAPAEDEDVLGADALDALAAGLAAVALANGAVRLAGNAAEGQIVLPEAEALARALGMRHDTRHEAGGGGER